MKRYSRVMAAILSIALVVSSAFVGDAFAKQQGGKKRGKTVKRSVQFINGADKSGKSWPNWKTKPNSIGTSRRSNG